MSDMGAALGPRLYTIGAIGFTADAFFAALQAAEIDLFCDVRARRAMRGAAYAFANSRRLQDRLATLGMRYVHRPELAPDAALRSAQGDADRAAGVAKRKRTALNSAFVSGYMTDVLVPLDSRALLAELMPAQRIAFFCVEREPQACHRSLLVAKLAHDLALDVEHIVPEREPD